MRRYARLNAIERARLIGTKVRPLVKAKATPTECRCLSVCLCVCFFRPGWLLNKSARKRCAGKRAKCRRKLSLRFRRASTGSLFLFVCFDGRRANVDSCRASVEVSALSDDDATASGGASDDSDTSEADATPRGSMQSPLRQSLSRASFAASAPLAASAVPTSDSKHRGTGSVVWRRT